MKYLLIVFLFLACKTSKPTGYYPVGSYYPGDYYHDQWITSIMDSVGDGMICDTAGKVTHFTLSPNNQLSLYGGPTSFMGVVDHVLAWQWKENCDTLEILSPLKIHYIKIGKDVYDLSETLKMNNRVALPDLIFDADSVIIFKK